MNALTAHGIESVFHYAPLHYLVFIARSKALLAKAELTRRGYAASHFRSTSQRQDVTRGFEDFVHLTLEGFPPIFAAKLKRGFPHFTIRVPAAALDGVKFDLCRYNIAKMRYLRRRHKLGPKECSANGFYRGKMQVPIARGNVQCQALLKANHGRNMIEVLVSRSFSLPEQTSLFLHSSADFSVASELLAALGLSWDCKLAPQGHCYTANASYRRRVTDFLERCAADKHWMGDGLDFDRL
jgi:hypothetical protein